MNRLLNFDIAKVLCIILVVIGHFFPSNAPIWYINFRSWIYTFHMPAFMFISGFIYILLKKNESYLSFIKKKFFRLMIPYLTASVTIISLKLLTQQEIYVENPVSALSYFHIFYKPEAGYFLWFIWSLFSIFLIIPLFNSPLKRLILFFLAISFHYIPADVTSIFAINETKRMLMWFMLGTCCYDWNILGLKENPHFTKFLFFPICITIAFFILSFFNVAQPVLPWLGIFSVLTISTLAEKFKRSLVIRLLIFISPSTYIIYIFHTTFEGFAKAIFDKINILSNSPDLSFCVKGTAAILCGIIAPILLHRFILNRYKILSFLFGLTRQAHSSKKTETSP